MNYELVAAATAGASRGVIEYRLRSKPIVATAAAIGLALTVHALSDQPEALIVAALAITVGAIILANQLN